MTLDSFHSPAAVAVIGASGGIGSEFVRQLAELPTVGSIQAFSRSQLGNRSVKVANHSIDICDEASVACAAGIAAAAGPLDLVIVASGLLHDKSIVPEKTIQSLEADKLIALYTTNAVGPALLAKHFLPLLRKDSKTVFAALSARVGSISDNRLGGWAAYRASKAALNMLIRTCAIEHARKFPQSVVVALHPGTVDTSLSRPFSKNVPDGKLFTPKRAVSQLIEVVDGISADMSGDLIAWDGKVIPY